MCLTDALKRYIQKSVYVYVCVCACVCLFLQKKVVIENKDSQKSRQPRITFMANPMSKTPKKTFQICLNVDVDMLHKTLKTLQIMV